RPSCLLSAPERRLLVRDLQAEKVCCNAKVVSAVSVPAQGFVRLSPQSLCSFRGHPERLAAKPFKSL
ncbi:MAG: hypothetical protein ACT6WE_33600, partial [Shinella sp.]|uniref:hypothetical protein n=1 Tax=Shinella sp. TaxID=1870904 RepID=UPI0040370E1A